MILRGYGALGPSHQAITTNGIKQALSEVYRLQTPGRTVSQAASESSRATRSSTKRGCRGLHGEVFVENGRAMAMNKALDFAQLGGRQSFNRPAASRSCPSATSGQSFGA